MPELKLGAVELAVSTPAALRLKAFSILPFMIENVRLSPTLIDDKMQDAMGVFC